MRATYHNMDASGRVRWTVVISQQIQTECSTGELNPLFISMIVG